MIAMLSPKRLVEKAKKGIPLMRSTSSSSSSSGSFGCSPVVAEKGHFFVYTVDDARFMVPLAFLKSCIFQELLEISKDEFGLPGDGPITFACTAAFMEYILSLLSKRVSGDVERALIASIGANRCSESSLVHVRLNQQQAVA